VARALLPFRAPMPALFTPRADRWLRAAILAALVFVLGTPTLLMAWVRTPQVTGEHDPVQQPVLFDHRHHVQDAAIECRYCHDGADRSAQAGIPATSVCMGCHGQVWNRSEQLAPVRRSYFEDEPIRWNRVHKLPDFVYFNHAVHVTAGVSCQVCHGPVETMAQVQQVAPLTMIWCLECHREPEKHFAPARPVARLTHCSACHR